MFALVRKYRDVLALVSLVAMAVVTVFAHNRPGDEIGPVMGPARDLVLRFEAPVEHAINATVFKGIDVWQGYVGLRNVRAENLALRQRLLHAEGEHLAEGEIVKENERLRELLAFADAAPLKTVAARVVGDSLAPSALTRVIRIGVGRSSGVLPQMAVLSEQGVVGRVSQAFDSFADVQLLVDPGMSVAVRVERSRARANVVGTGHDHRAELEYALRSDDIEEGDLLVTSGTDQVFPPGLTVGKVVDVQRKTSATFLKAQVTPAVDPRALQEVLVVLAPKESIEAKQ